jgi:TIR domain
MVVPETSIKELTDFLKSRKIQRQRVGLFLGHRTGVLYNNAVLYEALKACIAVSGNLSSLLKPNTPIPYDKLAHHIQLFANLAPSNKFKECYSFLSRHFSENGIHSILFHALKPPPYRGEDELTAKLIKAGFFDTILTTNFDTLLEDACDSLGMKEPVDYGLFICGSDNSKTLGKSSIGGQIVKTFGDFDSLNYKTVGNEFDIEADQQLKKFLESEMAKDIVVLGYDATWDKPIEQAFQRAGGMIWYVNEEQPSPNTHIAHVLDQRYSKFVGGQDWNYGSFLRTLSDLIEEKVNQEPTIQPPLLLASSHDPARKKAFISYSHKDKKYLARLTTHLKGYLHQLKDRVDVWDDTKIPVGANWQEEIEKALAQSKVAVCLVSADFFGSDFIREKELPVMYEAARAKQVQIVSIIISDSVFEDSDLFIYQTINPPNKPLIKMGIDEREAIWRDLAKHIFTILTT